MVQIFVHFSITVLISLSLQQMGLKKTTTQYQSVLSVFAGVWWFGVDPGGVDPCDPSKPSRMGDVCLHLLLCHDLSLDDHVCCWSS